MQRNVSVGRGAKVATVLISPDGAKKRVKVGVPRGEVETQHRTRQDGHDTNTDRARERERDNQKELRVDW